MELDLERRVLERTRELHQANEALRGSQQMLATELVPTHLINARAERGCCTSKSSIRHGRFCTTITDSPGTVNQAVAFSV